MIRFQSVLILLFVCFSGICTAQQLEDKILLTIDGNEYDAGTFMRVYLKNLDIVQDPAQKDMDSYLQLYIDYRLKLLQAQEMGLQNGESYKQELKSYRNSLAESYLTDNEVTDALVQEAYARMTQEVNASHILVKANRTATPEDTVAAYKKIELLKKRVANGEDFAVIARNESEGPSAVSSGELGWFGPFKMVDEFEDAAYQTQVGKVSPIFRTDFGYHILKVNDKRKAPGDVTVAHIMTYDQRNDSIATAQERIEEIYGQLEAGRDFAAMAREFSEDINSSRNGGTMPRFGTGGLNAPEFEQAAFEIDQLNSYTKPVQTKYGWHIIKLIEKHPVPSFEESEENLRKQIQNSPRSRKITEAFTNKLIAKYKVQLPNINSYTSQFPQVTDSLMMGKWRFQAGAGKAKGLFVIRDQAFTVNDFYEFVSKKQQKEYRQFGSLEEKLATYYKEFINDSLIGYYDTHLERDNKDFAFIYGEYKEGLLLFDLMEKKVWEEAKVDSLGQMKYYEAHKDKYRWKRRLDIVMTQSTTEDVAQQVRSLLLDGKDVEEIKDQVNEKGNTKVMVSTGIVEETYPRLPKGFQVKEGVSSIFEKEENGFYKVIKVNEILEPSIKTFEEARGNVVNDYQQELEKQWMDNLREGRKIKVNDKVFQQVKQEVTKKGA
ncbi:peptidylprolyl isomerase [Nonlabens marinus]|uniref:Survival protein SurA n=1 Tax=Nonlabens marinus S1-08 TaxID=1454201 RepID=W8VVS5_9FLAO|nr:peptidylprolyl isomerase [Nonlabens marinus]BAO54142.1 survival protein SurA precursor [Nonlabens marinus S1-08]